MDEQDWKRLQELIYQAGGVAHSTSADVPDVVRADAMSFNTLGLALLDLHDRMARHEAASNKPLFYGPMGERLNG